MNQVVICHTSIIAHNSFKFHLVKPDVNCFEHRSMIEADSPHPFPPNPPLPWIHRTLPIGWCWASTHGVQKVNMVSDGLCN